VADTSRLTLIQTAESILQQATNGEATKAEEAIASPKVNTKRRALLEQINKRYAVILNVGGHCVVADLRPSPEQAVQLISWDNFKKRFANVFVSDENSKGRKSAGGWWLAHPDHRQYEGLVLEPAQASELTVGGRNFLNLWRGWGIQPRRGDWKLMRHHISHILAAGDEGFCDYILKWCAFAVQYPNKRAEVALVFKGKKGSGKSLFGGVLTSFFGREHGKTQSDPKRLTGQFNAFLRDTILLFLDEMRWNSRRDDEGILQNMITGPTIFIEDKNISQYEWPNLLHIVICSNAHRVIPATEGERRYATGVTDNHYAKDMCPEAERTTYFNALHRELDNGGREAMLHDLLHMPLGDWHPRVGYQTRALQEEKEQGVTGYDAYYQTILENGFLPPSARVPNKVKTSHLHEDLKIKVPDMARTALNQLGIYLGQQHFERLGIKPWRTSSGAGWEFPKLSLLRRNWEQRMGGHKWPNDLSDWVFKPSKDDETKQQ
jgi:hypothetical protein